MARLAFRSRQHRQRETYGFAVGDPDSQGDRDDGCGPPHRPPRQVSQLAPLRSGVDS
jgi:hypothetical protein